jgi:hypothetical protein
MHTDIFAHAHIHIHMHMHALFQRRDVCCAPGSQFGTRTADLTSVELAGVACTSLSLLNATQIACVAGAATESVRRTAPLPSLSLSLSAFDPRLICASAWVAGEQAGARVHGADRVHDITKRALHVLHTCVPHRVHTHILLRVGWAD